MPYGHKRQYLELIAEVSRQRVEITKRQQRQIAAAYQEIADDLERQLAGKSKRSLTYRWLQDYARALRRGSKTLYAGLEDVVTGNMLDIAQAVVGVQMSLFGEAVPELSGRFSDVFSSIPQQAVNELMHGGVYQDFTGLSERLWDYRRKFDRDISEIINNGITAQRSAFDLAKDLEQYLQPGAVHTWEWSKVYPGVNKTVDYSAQRLARTSVTHAYQLSTVRATRQNPFVEAYRWLSSGGRACPLCMERNNKLFAKDAVPLDHPNGMCTIIPEIKKSYEQIADELGEWAAGGENPALDQWLGDQGLVSRRRSGIINSGRDAMRADVLIDKFTPCLVDRATGKVVNTAYSVAAKSELRGLRNKGWNFDWTADDLKDATVYKLTLEGKNEIEGLIALTDYKSDSAVYVNIAESAPHNLGKAKRYDGVGGHLFAIAAQVSVDHGFGGFIFMDAKNQDLVKHYHDKMGAQLLGMPHPYRMYIDEQAARKLLEIYTLGGAGNV